MRSVIALKISLMIGAAFVWPQAAAAQAEETAIPRPALMGLAREFVARMQQAKPRVDAMLNAGGGAAPNPNDIAARGLSEGEILIFQGLLPGRVSLDDIFTGRVTQGQISVSLRDVVSNLEFAIDVDPATASAEGWYVRENKKFSLDTASRTVVSAEGTFALSSAAVVEEGDIFVPLKDLESWFGITMQMDVSTLEIVVDSDPPLPVQERLARRKMKFQKYQNVPAALPRGDDAPKAFGIPMADVSTNSSYTRPGSGSASSQHTANIRTAGDFAYGTLYTQTLLSKENHVESVRATYKKESLLPELLGPMQARKYELGDIVTTEVPLTGNYGQGMGARVSNANPLQSYTRPSTQITGVISPGWDVELYRDEMLIDLQTTGDDGRYLFDSVDLYRSENNFRLVFYGPQGEVREENLYIPVDPNRLSDEGAYDVSLSLDDKQIYRADDGFEDEDEGAWRAAAYYEHPVGDSSALSVGATSMQVDGERQYYGHAGLSTAFMGALLNFDVASDHHGEMAAEFVTRRDFGAHEFRNTMSWATDDYQMDQAIPLASREVFGNRSAVRGPLPELFGLPSMYNLSFNYGIDSLDSTRYDAQAGINTSINRIALGQSFLYSHDEAVPDDEIRSLTTMAGRFGKNRVRLTGDYEIQPESRLSRLTAALQRQLTPDLDGEVSLEKRYEDSLVEGTAQLNWRTGKARISPSVSYNNNNDFRAMLSTNFGLMKDPNNGVRMLDRNVSQAGAVSALVFMDKDGDGLFNGEDEPLPDITVRSLQNGGRGITGPDGVAVINNMTRLQLTDVFVEQDSLPDPFWVPGYEGASIMPREGAVASMQFPIHVAGEMDGTLFVRKPDGQTAPLRDVKMHLFAQSGKIAKTTQTGSDGFYLFDVVPPGYYMLMIDDADARRYKLERPLPQQVVIGYDGTIIYGNDITVNSGSADVPVGFAAGIGDYLAANPDVDPAALAGRTAILNLGSYKSQLLMGLVWYELQHRYAGLLGGGRLLVAPSQSYAAPETGLHELLVEMPGLGLEEAVRRCRALAARQMACSVEMVPVQGLPSRTARADGSSTR